MALYVRFESAVANRHGTFVGVFALANGLAASGRVSPDDWLWWRSNNDWLNAAYPDPAAADPTIFDVAINPSAASWFKTSAGHLLDRVPGYLELLDRYQIAWVRKESDQRGRILYEDDVQVVVAPFRVECRRLGRYNAVRSSAGFDSHRFPVRLLSP